MKNNPPAVWLPSPKLVTRLLVVLIVILALSAGYYSTLAENRYLNHWRILNHLDVTSTREILNYTWEKK
jgi:hypothetical protein